jgi:hypothetical protein
MQNMTETLPKISLHDTGRSPLPRCEDYKVNLDGVWMLQLVIDSDNARGASVASLASWRLA